MISRYLQASPPYVPSQSRDAENSSVGHIPRPPIQPFLDAGEAGAATTPAGKKPVHLSRLAQMAILPLLGTSVGFAADATQPIKQVAATRAIVC